MIPRGRLRVLQVCTSRSWGGMEMQALQTAQCLSTHGIEIFFLCHPESQLHRDAGAAGIKTLAMRFANGVHPLLIYRLRRFLQARQIDLLHAHFSKDLRFIVPACEGLSPRRPIVLTKHLGSYIKKKDALHRYLYARVDLVTAISRVIRDNVIDTCPIEARRVEIIYNGVDLARFRFQPEVRRRMRSELGFGENEIVIGMVGRMSPGKGHEEFLHAAKIILQKEKAVKFLIVGGASFGEDKYAAQVQELWINLQLQDRVLLTGFRREVPELMSALDILAFPSHAEAFGNVAIEAMAMRLPVVSTNCDGVVDIVVDGVTGIHVPPKNSEALAEGLLQLIRDPERRQKYGEAGRRRVEDMFDDEKQTQKLIERYEQLATSSM